jgi:hypothetical protein
MSGKLLPVRLRTDVQEVENRVEISKGVHDRSSGQAPSVDRVQIPSGFAGSGVLVSDHVRFIENDSVPQDLEQWTWQSAQSRAISADIP